MKKVLFIVLGIVALAAIALLVMRSQASMDMPQGKSGPAADALALKMMQACNYEAWKDTRYVAWTFAGSNKYIWDRSASRVKVISDNCEIILNSSTGKGMSYSQQECSLGEKTRPLLSEKAEEAWSNFCNDSFWLIAPLKVMDEGVTREQVETTDGPALLVHYGSGGVTPGDSYLWYLSDDGLPYSYRMWTSVLPVPGMEATWEGWTQLHTGVKIASRHKLGPTYLELTEIRSGSTLAEIGESDKAFL